MDSRRVLVSVRGLFDAGSVGAVLGQFAIDHFAPIGDRPDLILAYDNLLYACISCNLAKADQIVPDPLTVAIATTIRIAPDGVAHGETPAAGRLIELVGLNRPRLVEFRELCIGIIRLAQQRDPGLMKRLLGFPENLPNLSRLAPPDGNSKPEGIKSSHFRRRERGELPETY